MRINNWLAALFITALSVLPMCAMAQSPVLPFYRGSMAVNYVRTWEAMAPDTTHANVNVSIPVVQFKMATLYTDGLGRPIQTVSKQGSLATGSASRDLVSSTIYDEMGREQYKYLPFVADTTGGNIYIKDGFFKINPFQQDTVFNKAQFPGESWFYDQKVFEASPLSRPLKAMPAGNSWVGTSRGIESKYWINTVTDSVRIWTVTDVSNGFGTYATSSTYPAGRLYKNVTIDEHGKQVIEFKDKSDLVILKKVQLTATADTGTGKGYQGWLCTYYIYDSLDRLRCVVQPKGVELLLANSWSITALSGAILNEQCFRYEYDHRSRMIRKKVPGAGQVWMVYDARDRLVLSQDSAMRIGQKWMYTVYENIFNRPTETGFITDGSNYNNLSYHLVRADSSSAYPNLGSYTSEELTRTFYDDYSWRSSYGNPLSSTRSTTDDSYLLSASNTIFPYAQAVSQSSDLKGMVTGTRTKVLGTTDYLYTVHFYDGDGRLIQLQSTNITGGTDIVTTQYSWNDQPLLAIQRQAKGSPNSQTIVALTKLSYDSLWRVSKIEKKVSHSQVNNGDMPGSWTTIVEHEYDKLAQLAKKKLAPAFNSGAGLESLQYDYNIRGWMLGMNRSYVKDSANTAKYFGFDLGYDKDTIVINSLSRLYAAKQYNGNISGMLWKSTGDDQLRKYDFTYDAANRILSADFNQFTATNFSKSAGIDFSLSSMSYDANGNILGMKHRGLKLASSATIDSLVYNYIANSNKLLNVIDGADDPATKLGDFRTSALHPSSGSKSSSTADYTYDGNGNMVKDLNKDIIDYTGSNGIGYNYLNLPQTITVKKDGSSNKGTIIYTYDALGIKLKKTVYEPGVDTTVTLYMGSVVYKNDTLEFISHEEGRIRKKDSLMLVYDYMVKDHLGNVRMLLTEERDTSFYPVASMESIEEEEIYYSRLEETKVELPNDYPEDNSYPWTNHQVARVMKEENDNSVGPGITLKVMAGDKFNLQVRSWYTLGGGGTPTHSTPILDALLDAIAGDIGKMPGISHTGEQLTTSGVLVPGATGFVDMQDNGINTSKPPAFVNWILFDEQFRFVSSSSGAEQVGDDEEFKLHVINEIPVNKNGYLYIFVSNGSLDVPVFFDNLQVTHVRGPILEETHYYPFGLTMKGISSKALVFGSPENKKNKFQDQELNDDLGVNYYEFKYRNHDPQVGRFIQIDPLSDKYVHNSTYAFSENQVTSHVELEGLEKLSIQDFWREAGISSSTDPKQYVRDLGKEAVKPKPWIEGAATAGQIAVPVLLITIMTGGTGDAAILSSETNAVRASTSEASLAASLESRANQIQSVLRAETQRRTTTAVATAINSEGNTVTLVSSSEKSLRPQQLKALNLGEIPVSGSGHAEATIMNHASSNGMKVTAIGTSRPVCANCAFDAAVHNDKIAASATETTKSYQSKMSSAFQGKF